MLTEERFFQGNPQHLEAIRDAVEVPLLRKDFVFDPYQLVEARAWGADAALLIVGHAGRRAARRAACRGAGCSGSTCWSRRTRPTETARAVAVGARLIGINNRDLRTFVTSLETAERLRPLIPAGAVAVAESGIETPADIARLRSGGLRAPSWSASR